MFQINGFTLWTLTSTLMQSEHTPLPKRSNDPKNRLLETEKLVEDRKAITTYRSIRSLTGLGQPLGHRINSAVGDFMDILTSVKGP